MSTRPSMDKAVDAFVSRLNASVRPRLAEDGVPPDLRVGEVDGMGEVGWVVAPAAGAPWIETLEARLPRPYPPSFRSLVMRYRFPSFDVGSIHLFGNTGDLSRDEELADMVFRDEALSEVLLKHGYVQIGWRTDVWYDPVCFDTGSRRGGGEYEIVRLDHEEALCWHRATVVERIAPSFLHLLDSDAHHG